MAFIEREGDSSWSILHQRRDGKQVVVVGGIYRLASR